jgi:hypothetical protein
MKDTISEADLLVDVTKTEIESRLVKSERNNEILIERLEHLENFVKQLVPHVDETHKFMKEERLKGQPLKVELM